MFCLPPGKNKYECPKTGYDVKVGTSSIVFANVLFVFIWTLRVSALQLTCSLKPLNVNISAKSDAKYAFTFVYPHKTNLKFILNL